MLKFTVPDRRFYSLRSKKPCRCTHGISAHHKEITPKGVTHPCWYPGCDWKDYRPENRASAADDSKEKAQLAPGFPTIRDLELLNFITTTAVQVHLQRPQLR
jgi:hypothetical protein